MPDIDTLDKYNLWGGSKHIAKAQADYTLRKVMAWIDGLTQHFDPFIENDWVDLHPAAVSFQQGLLKKIKK